LVDVPNHRSSHKIPTPGGGGIALVAAVIAVTTRVLAESMVSRVFVFALIGGAVTALAVVGWLDDRAHMPVTLRFSVHLLCALSISLLVNLTHPLAAFLNIAWLAWWIFWTLASINIVNFMDGIDGMVASQGVVYGVFLFALVPSDLLAERFGLILAAACLGFLLWNWAPAKMFMGDVGSGPLGFLFVFGGALALEGAPASLVFLPLFPLFLDALVTLLGRARRGERLTEAHRLHLYQRVANEAAGHAMVTLAYALAATVGALVAIAVRHYSPLPMALAIVAYISVVSALWLWADATMRLHRGSMAGS
jgi:UDP-N-acetylmuramyl pentapeptide phosphotransferase/UDP-N-acetylglucosamine-1-phosphate transferase